LESKSKEQIELPHTNINDKCSQLLEANILKLMNPNLVIDNVLEEWEASTKGELTKNFFSTVKDIMSMKNFNDTIGNRSYDLLVCSAVPQPLRHHVPPI
jgi:hypothetical protein